MAKIHVNLKETASFLMEKATIAGDRIAKFARENPDLRNDLILIGALTAGNMLKNHSRNRKATATDRKNIHKDWYYDARTHCYYELRRPMTNSEKMILSRKINRGYLACDVLDDLGLLRI